MNTKKTKVLLFIALITVLTFFLLSISCADPEKLKRSATVTVYNHCTGADTTQDITVNGETKLVVKGASWIIRWESDNHMSIDDDLETWVSISSHSGWVESFKIKNEESVEKHIYDTKID